MHNIRLGVTRRCGTALLISPESNKDRYLLGQDISLCNPSFGESGDGSLPMSHTRMQDSATTSITRVLQQEVFTQNCINGNFPFNLIPENSKPIFYINIADIKVAVFRLIFPDEYHDFSSYKLCRFSFKSALEIKQAKIRPGVGEIVKNFELLRYAPQNDSEIVIDSNLNLALAKLPERLN